MLAAGFAHAGPGHLVGNVLGALVLSPLVEYAWGHYPSPRRKRAETSTDHPHPPPSAAPDPSAGQRDDGRGAAGKRSDGRALLARPWVRALVLFPLGIVAVSLLTSVFALGWSLGYSGTVFFLLGFALVALPLTTVVGVVVTSGVSVVFSTLQTPVVRATVSSGGPSPPAWAGINWQAHLLGFLLGVVAALVLLWYRDEWPDPERIAFAAVVVALARSLWLVSTASDGEFVLWRAVGVIFVLAVVFLLVATVAMENEPLFRGVTVRQVLLATLVAVPVILALPSAATNAPGMAADPVPESGGVTVADYTVTYGENVSHGRIDDNASGVIVVSERRDIWSTAVSPAQLASRENVTVPVGGIGWREAVEIERTGWDVAGNDSVYAITVSHDDQTARPFQSAPKEAQSRVDNRTITVAATADAFRLNVSHDGQRAGSVAIPERNASVSVGGLTFSTEEHDDSDAVFAERGGTRVLVAQRE
jgi:membrane associated rhomboid family serine protease